MGDDLGDFRRRDAVVESDVDVVLELGCLVSRDQYRQGDNAAIPPGQLRPLPQIPQHILPGVSAEGRRHRFDIVKRQG